MSSSPLRYAQSHTRGNSPPGHMQLRGCLRMAWQPERGSLPLLWQLWLGALPHGRPSIHYQACDPASHGRNSQHHMVATVSITCLRQPPAKKGLEQPASHGCCNSEHDQDGHNSQHHIIATISITYCCYSLCFTISDCIDALDSITQC